MAKNNHSKITQIFSASDVKHGLSLFTKEEIDLILSCVSTGRAIRGERHNKYSDLKGYLFV